MLQPIRMLDLKVRAGAPLSSVLPLQSVLRTLLQIQTLVKYFVGTNATAVTGAAVSSHQGFVSQLKAFRSTLSTQLSTPTVFGPANPVTGHSLGSLVPALVRRFRPWISDKTPT